MLYLKTVLKINIGIKTMYKLSRVVKTFRIQAYIYILSTTFQLINEQISLVKFKNKT